jgi:hypothetical protein
MKFSNAFAKDHSIALAVGAGVLIFGAWVAWRIFEKVTNPNKGTAYEGSGAVGTLGNVVNTALGGAPEAVGEAIGGTIFDWFNPDPGVDTYLAVRLPDGTRISVHGSDKFPTVPGKPVMDSQGRFEYEGRLYRTYIDKATGLRYAQRISV